MQAYMAARAVRAFIHIEAQTNNPERGQVLMDDIKVKIKVFLSRFFQTSGLREDDDFFTLGFVNSLFAMQLVTWVEKEFCIQIEDRRPRGGELQHDCGYCQSRFEEEMSPTGRIALGSNADIKGAGMEIELTQQQQSEWARFKRFASAEIAPDAERADREERFSEEVLQKIAGKGYLGSILPREWGGRELDLITYGLLHEETGRACSSARSIITVHDMVALAILKWGSERQREWLLPRLASGESIGALAVSEPNVGSDAKSIETTAERSNGSYVLNGTKKWITSGQIADIFLVLARYEDRPTAFLVERGRSGVSVKPISGMLGVRASMIAEISFRQCEVPLENLIGRPGFGLISVIMTALGLGRYSVAWGAVGIAQACLNACIRYTSQRKQFGSLLKEHQLIQEMITEMMTNVKAARLLCRQAGYLKQEGDPREIVETLIAKYFASRTAMRSAIDAVQIHGANGCSGEYPVQRFLRDAKVMEVIEGSNQIQQLMIAKYAFQEYE
jgi:glutaryl-CoA dehydrogenase (non-decarboxylating)